MHAFLHITLPIILNNSCVRVKKYPFTLTLNKRKIRTTKCSLNRKNRNKKQPALQKNLKTNYFFFFFFIIKPLCIPLFVFITPCQYENRKCETNK